MKYLAVVFLLLFIASCTETSDRIKVDFLVINANVITMNSEIIQKKQTIAIKDGLILAIGSSDQMESYKGKQLIDAKDGFLMPGLADMHVHVRMNPIHNFKLFLANGVTTVRNMGIRDGSHDHVALRGKVSAGEFLGPRYLITGPQIKSENTSTKAMVDTLMQEHQENQYDFMKIHGDMDEAVFDYLIAEAKKKSIRVTGHLQHNLPLDKSLTMDSIEHVEEFLYAVHGQPQTNVKGGFLEQYREQLKLLADDDYLNDIIQKVKNSGVYVSPTLTIYHALPSWVDDREFENLKRDSKIKYLTKKVKDKWLSDDKNPYREDGFPLGISELRRNGVLLKRIVKGMHQAGIPFILGVDAFGTVVPGFSVHRELQLMVDSGLSNYEALETATINVAYYLNERDKRGSIEKGKDADFIILSKNPLANIENTKSIFGVMTQGQWLLTDILLDN
ncbi:MAG: amidohydrolase family protein [Balneola sp.]